MACRFSELVVDSREPESLAAFWAEVLGYEVLGREEDGGPEGGERLGVAAVDDELGETAGHGRNRRGAERPD